MSTVLSPLEKIIIFVAGTITSWFGILECLAQGICIARTREILVLSTGIRIARTHEIIIK